MSLFHRVERRDYAGGAFTNPYANPFGPPWSIPTNGQTGIINGGPGYLMSPAVAMRHWAVWASVRIIADTISSLPIDLFKGNPDGDPIDVDPLPPVLLNPSAYATWTQWVYQAMVSLLLSGNVYGLIASTDRLGYPNQIDIISPQTVQVKKDDNGKKYFEVRGAKDQRLTTSQLWHLPGPMMPGDLAGMSPIQYASRTMSLGLDAEKFGSDYFRNGAHPTAVATSDQQVNEDQARTIKQRIYEAVANRQIAVLGAGLTLTQWQVNPNDSQFLETQRFNAVTVAQIFGVPPEMIGAATRGDTITYANREQRAQDFLNNAVNPWLTRLEEALSAWFPRTMYVKFNTGGLLRSDLAARYAAHQIGIAAGFLLRSEARALEDLPTIPGLDKQPLPGATPVTPPQDPAVGVPKN